MLGDVDLGVDRLERPVGRDQIGNAPGEPFVGRACGVVREAEGAIGVRQQQERKRELLGERLVLLDRVVADAVDDRVVTFKLLDSIPESFALDGSTGGVCLRIEPEQHVFAALVRQLDRRTVVGSNLEIRGGVADIQRWHGAHSTTCTPMPQGHTTVESTPRCVGLSPCDQS